MIDILRQRTTTVISLRLQWLFLQYKVLAFFGEDGIFSKAIVFIQDKYAFTQQEETHWELFLASRQFSALSYNSFRSFNYKYAKVVGSATAHNLCAIRCLQPLCVFNESSLLCRQKHRIPSTLIDWRHIYLKSSNRYPIEQQHYSFLDDMESVRQTQ